MKKILIKITVVAAAAILFSIIYISYESSIPPERLLPFDFTAGYVVSAEAIDNETVRVLIIDNNNPRSGFPVENTSEVFATTENGEMVSAIMTWPETWDEGRLTENVAGTYVHGKNPKGKEIEIKFSYEKTWNRSWRVVIS